MFLGFEEGFQNLVFVYAGKKFLMYSKARFSKEMGWESFGDEICNLNPKLVLALLGSREISQSSSSTPVFWFLL